MPFGIKRDVIEGLGVEELVVIPFDREFASIDPVEFCERILVEQLGATRSASARTSASAQRPRATPSCCASRPEFETRVVPLVEVEGETVSSTRIRALVSAGEVDEAAGCLGAPVHGRGSGRERRPARPHARLPDRQPRPRGRARHVPATASTRLSPNGKPAAVNVGVRPTFETGRGVLIETFILDHDEDLYGKTLRVAFVEAAAGREAVRRRPRN